MTAPLNPYAPPAEGAATSLEEPDQLEARFFVTRIWREKIAYDFLMPGAVMLTSSIFVLLAGMGIGLLLGPWFFTGNRATLEGLLIGFPLGAIGSIVFHLGMHYRLKQQNLRRLEHHPTLGADGEWLLAIDHEQLRIKSPGGISSWRLDDVWWHITHGELVLLQLPDKLVVGIPPDAELQPPLPSSFRKYVKSRVRRIPFVN